MNLEFAPLLAIDQMTLRIIFVIVVALVYVFNHFVGAAKAQQRKPPRPELRPRGPGPGKQEVNDEVAEFLRRTAERSGKKPPEPQAPQTPSRRPLVERGGASPPLRGELVEVEAVDEPPTGAGVASHVQRHLSNREFDQRASQLGSVEQEQRVFETQLHQAFDHQVGHLATRSEDSAAVASPSAAGALTGPTIAALLADPQNLRSAVVLNEILRRPIERW